MKYIIFDDGLNENPVIFPTHIPHTKVALLPLGEPISAGFLDENLTAGGESVGLKLKSRPEDTEIIRRLFRAKM